MSNLPSGTVTFLYTDVESSTRLWRLYPDAMPTAQARHHAILREAIEDSHGYLFRIAGDALSAAFFTATAALAAALEAQRALHREAWGETGSVRVRMGLHSGAAEPRAGDYEGYLTLSHVQRLMAAGHGGQVLLSQVTEGLVRDNLPPGISLRNLGERRLKDFERPEPIFQLVAPDLPADFPPITTLEARRGNLPVQLTSFVGREREMAEIKRLLAEDGGRRTDDGGVLRPPSSAVRLLTLTGPGGTGKTRLSLQVAAELVQALVDGAWLVELASVSDPALVPQSVATALDIREQTGRPLLATLTDTLRGKNLLLLLDNCEHLVAACAQLAEELLRACPRLKILASSREALGIAGETAWRVPSLSLPASDHGLIVEDVRQSEAVRLFVERAITVQPRFALTNQNAATVAQICRRLDGIPLALELAAARLKTFTVEQIAARLDDRFRLLTGGSRTAEPRQQTLRAAIDWSYDLLSEAERQLLRRLSVFAGGFTLEAAEQVTDDGRRTTTDEALALVRPPSSVVRREAVLELLTHLVDKSLVMVEGDEARYRLLDTTRQYARERLVESGEFAVMRERHLDFYLKFAEEGEEGLRSPEHGVWLRRLESEHDNLRAALQWSLESNPDAALRLAGALSFLWVRHRYIVEGLSWLHRALASVEPIPALSDEAAARRTAARARALMGLGTLTCAQGDYAKGRLAVQDSIATWRALDAKPSLGFALAQLGIVAANFSDAEIALSAAEEGVAIFREMGDKWGLAFALTALAMVAGTVQHDFPKAFACNMEAIRLARESGDRLGLALPLLALGMMAYAQGDYDTARARLEESADLFREQGDKTFLYAALEGLAEVARHQREYYKATAIYQEIIDVWQEARNQGAIARCLELLAFIAGEQAQSQTPPERPANLLRAARLFGAAEALREASASAMTPDEHTEYEASLAAVRAQMDETVFTAAWAEGRAMSMEQAVAYARAQTPST